MESALHSIGQVAVTIVGFAALLKAFNRENVTDPHSDPRLRSIVEQGLVVAVFCFLPALLTSFNLSSDNAARLVSGIAAVWLLRWLRILYLIRKAELRSSIAWRYRMAVVLHVIAFAAFLLSVSGIIGRAQPFFFSGIVVMLCVVGWAFLAQFHIERD
jgi:small-conductance mechanosensitive channel